MRSDFRKKWDGYEIDGYDIYQSGGGFILEIDDDIIGWLNGEHYYTWTFKIKYNSEGKFDRYLNKTKN
jgi:hypothetical protein